MMLLNEIFKKQRGVTQDEPDGIPETKDIVQFQCGDSTYAVAIESVREVIEPLSMIYYPEAVQGHIAIVSVRGEIVPVIDPFGLHQNSGSGWATQRTERIQEGEVLIILEFEPKKRFAILGKRPKKISIDSELYQKEKALNAGGVPVRILFAEDFFPETRSAGVAE